MISPSDLGLSSSETIKVEHVFTLHFSHKWERPIRKAAEAIVDVGYSCAESFRILAMGAAAYFVLSGLAQLVQSTVKTRDDDTSSKTGGSNRRSSSSRSTTGTSTAPTNSSSGRSSRGGTTSSVSQTDNVGGKKTDSDSTKPSPNSSSRRNGEGNKTSSPTRMRGNGDKKTDGTTTMSAFLTPSLTP